MKPQFSILLKILDEIRNSAPNEFQSYKPSIGQIEKLNAARGLSFIHFYLIVKCGLMEFQERHKLICDGTYDGGLDAYYIDQEKKRIFLIQSKFRTTEENFVSKSITADDLVKMDVDLIINGKSKDSSGNNFNSKILAFQKQLQLISDIARYKYKVILLANLTKYNDKQIRQLVGGFDYEIFDFTRSYQELVFPMCSGTYYDPSEITIQINLLKKEQPRLTQTIETNFGECEITIIYVPTAEIGKILLKYKNAILRYNPRNYLSLSNNNVNKKIRKTISDLSTNEFAILNNGITVLADGLSISQSTGKENVGQLILTNPQIINGGQTAYTLSDIYETEFPSKPEIFNGKEVMLKIVTLEGDKNKATFIEMISNSTNQQSKVKEADRRSNSETLVTIQQLIFEDYGYFFERKTGEFFNGLSKSFLHKSYLIDRSDTIRAFQSYMGKPSNAKKNETFLFSEETLKKLIPHHRQYRNIFFAHRLFVQLKLFEKNYKKKHYNKTRHRNLFRYGNYAVIAAVGMSKADVPNDCDKVDILAQTQIDAVLSQWGKFERYIKSLSQNGDYFGRGLSDFDNYFKGKTVDSDIKAFFGTNLKN